jgi:hypothetical protein
MIPLTSINSGGAVVKETFVPERLISALTIRSGISGGAGVVLRAADVNGSVELLASDQPVVDAGLVEGSGPVEGAGPVEDAGLVAGGVGVSTLSMLATVIAVSFASV